MVRHNGVVHCLTDALDVGQVSVSPLDAAHEAILPMVACGRDEPLPPEPAGATAATEPFFPPGLTDTASALRTWRLCARRPSFHGRARHLWTRPERVFMCR